MKSHPILGGFSYGIILYMEPTIQPLPPVTVMPKQEIPSAQPIAEQSAAPVAPVAPAVPTEETKLPDAIGVLYITDKVQLFDQNSPDRATMLEYAKRVGELHIIIITSAKNAKNIEQISTNVWLYPTNNAGAISAFLSAKKIIKEHCVWQNKLRANLVVADSPLLTGVIAAYTAKKYKKRFFLEYRKEYLSMSKLASFRDSFKQWIVGQVVSRATRVLVSSARHKDVVADLLPRGQEQVTVLPTFINVEAMETDNERMSFTAKYPGVMFMIVMSSELSREQDIDLAIDIVREVIMKYQQVGMLIIGDGAEKNNLKGRIKRMGLDTHIFFEDTPLKLAPYFRGANLFLSTARVDDETLGAVQALAASTPVIVTSANSVAPILKGTPYERWVCPVGDTACFSKNILEFIQHTGLRDDFRINAKYVIADRMKGFDGNHFDHMVTEWKNTFLYK